jgi:hypothetical protein
LPMSRRARRISVSALHKISAINSRSVRPFVLL